MHLHVLDRALSTIFPKCIRFSARMEKSFPKSDLKFTSKKQNPNLEYLIDCVFEAVRILDCATRKQIRQHLQDDVVDLLLLVQFDFSCVAAVRLDCVDGRVCALAVVIDKYDALVAVGQAGRRDFQVVGFVSGRVASLDVVGERLQQPLFQNAA